MFDIFELMMARSSFEYGSARFSAGVWAFEHCKLQLKAGLKVAVWKQGSTITLRFGSAALFGSGVVDGVSLQQLQTYLVVLCNMSSISLVVH